MENPAGPLTGIKVLEFAHAVMGPSCGLILADLGADVIHIEPPQGDSTRYLKGFGSGYFSYFNRNKKSFAVDLKTQEGNQSILELLRKSDVVIENFSPGTMDRLGLGFKRCQEIKKDIIYCSLKGFLPGPYENRLAMDEVVQMMSGLAYMTGKSGEPLRAGSSVVDITGGIFGALGILLALRHKDQTGEGQLVKSGLFESSVFLMGQHMAYATLSQDPIPPMPERVSAWSIYRIFKCSDEKGIFIGIISDAQWNRFCTSFQLQALADDPRLATNNQRIDQLNWLIPYLENVMAEIPSDHVSILCEQSNIPFAPVKRPEDLFDDIHLKNSDRLIKVDFPQGVSGSLPQLPFDLSLFKKSLRYQPPLVGEHTHSLLKSIGMSAKEMEDFYRKGSFSTNSRPQKLMAAKDSLGDFQQHPSY